MHISGTTPEEKGLEGGNLLEKGVAEEKPLQGEIAHEKAPTPVFDDTKVRLQFWRDSKTFLETLSARINQLRTITQETSERMRRHGTAEVLERLKPNEQTPTNNDLEIIPETPESGIMSQLHKKFTEVNTKLTQLQILVTGVRLGPRGPLDPQYSESWIEHHVHEDEKIEFEKTAVKMGFAPNSISMEPIITEEQKEGMEMLDNEWFETVTRIGVGGEYHSTGITPVKGMYPYLDVAQEFIANSGMSDSHQRMKLYGLERTLRQFGLDKMEDEEVEKDLDEKAREELGEADKQNDEEMSAAVAEGCGVPDVEELGECMTLWSQFSRSQLRKLHRNMLIS